MKIKSNFSWKLLKIRENSRKSKQNIFHKHRPCHIRTRRHFTSICHLIGLYTQVLQVGLLCCTYSWKWKWKCKEENNVSQNEITKLYRKQENQSLINHKWKLFFVQIRFVQFHFAQINRKVEKSIENFRYGME